MKVTIITDVSVNNQKRVAAGAFYIGCKSGSLKKSYEVKSYHTSIQVMELECICNALYTLKKNPVQGLTFI